MLVEYYDCEPDIINNRDRVREIMLNAAECAKATIVTDVFHTFSPHGVSGVVVIAESHVAIHTWPEHGYAAVDIFSCSPNLNRTMIQNHLEKAFRAGQTTSVDLKRGVCIPSKPPRTAPSIHLKI